MKLLGALLVILSTFGIYETLDGFQKKRLAVLRGYKTFVKELKRCFAKGLERGQAVELAKGAFPAYIESLRDTESYLTDKERESIEGYMEGLGKQGLLQEQKKADVLIGELEEYYADSFREYREKRNMNRSISIFAGLFIALMLF